MAPSFAVPARRGAAALAAAVVLSAAMAPAAFADASPSPAGGLYGTTDPKFDGVFRQSLAFVAQGAAGVRPAKSAVDWLAGQQCADGGFAAYRADVSKACDPQKDEFTDATAAAVQGLVAAGGQGDAVKKGLDRLKAHQNADGGWGYQAGSPTDANSTSIAIGAFAAAGQDPAKDAVKDGKNPVDALRAFQLGCDAKEGERGAFSYLKDKDGLRADNLASAAAGLATRGKGFLVGPVKRDADEPVKPLSCEDGDGAPKDAAAAAEAVDGYLAAVLDKNGGYLLPSMPGAPAKPDQGSTADAVLALAAGGHRTAAEKPLKWLASKESGTAAWADKNPGKLAKLVLAAHAAGADPRAFGGADLVAQLTATGPKPEAADTAADEKKDEKKKDDDKGFGTWWVVGVFFVASVGAGFLISGRKKKQQL